MIMLTLVKNFIRHFEHQNNLNATKVIKTVILSMAVFLSSCGFLDSEYKTQTDIFWYTGGAFNNDGSISYILDVSSSWGPYSSHTHTNIYKELHKSNSNNSNDHTIFKFQESIPDYFAKVHSAILQDKTVFVTGFTTSGQSEVRIYNSDGSNRSTTSISATPNNISISPDESKIAVSTEESFYIFNKNGESLKSSTTGGYFVWKSNSEGYFYNTQSSKLSLYNADSDSITDINSNFKPLQYNASTLELYSIEDFIFRTLNTGTLSITSDDLTSITSTVSTKYPIAFTHPSISSDGIKIIMDGSFGINDNFGIYMLDRSQNSIQVLFENRTSTYDI